METSLAYHDIMCHLIVCVYSLIITVCLILGLCTDGVYKVPGVKSKVQSLKVQYNRRQFVNLADYDLTVVTSLLKQYLRYSFFFFLKKKCQHFKNM